MIYPYKCAKCNHEWPVAKWVSEIDNPEICPSCESNDTIRQIANRFYFSGTDEKTEYYPAFGQYVTTRSQRKELMRKHGVEEIGNTSPESLHAWSEKTINDKCDKRWAE